MTTAPMTHHPLNFLITGAARGIGRGLSRTLLQKGHRVFLLDNNEPELAHTVTTLTSLSPAVHFASQTCNIRSPSSITAAASAASDFFNGHLDVLVNNAAFTGGVGGTALEDLTLEEWNASIETNLTGPLLMSQACLPMLKAKGQGVEGGGCIIHVSSTRAHQSEPDSEGYASAKAGLLGLTHSMAASLGPRFGIRVNAVLPGWIVVGHECKEGDEKGVRWEDGLTETDQRWHLTGRAGRVEDVVRVVEYLAEARFVTGSEQVVDGGVTKRMYYPEADE